jgi:hypothetical protein
MTPSQSQGKRDSMSQKVNGILPGQMKAALNFSWEGGPVLSDGCGGLQRPELAIATFYFEYHTTGSVEAQMDITANLQGHTLVSTLD